MGKNILDIEKKILSTDILDTFPLQIQLDCSELVLNLGLPSFLFPRHDLSLKYSSLKSICRYPVHLGKDFDIQGGIFERADWSHDLKVAHILWDTWVYIIAVSFLHFRHCYSKMLTKWNILPLDFLQISSQGSTFILCHSVKASWKVNFKIATQLGLVPALCTTMWIGISRHKLNLLIYRKKPCKTIFYGSFSYSLLIKGDDLLNCVEILRSSSWLTKRKLLLWCKRFHNIGDVDLSWCHNPNNLKWILDLLFQHFISQWLFRQLMLSSHLTVV